MNPGSLTVDSLLRAQSRRGDQPALRDARAVVTYGGLEPLTRRWATTLLDRGLAPGDRVGVSLANGVDAALAFLAVIRAGLVWVGVPRALAAAERQSLLDHVGVATVVDDTSAFDEGGADRGAGLPPAEAGRLAVISSTSGSSGRPKGVMHSQYGVVLAAVAAARRGEGRAVTGMYLPMTSVNMQILGPLTALAAGGCCLMIGHRSSDRVAEDVRRYAVNALPLALPTVVDWVADERITATTLRSLTAPVVGGSAVGDEVLDAYRTRFGTRLTRGYGLTEGPTSVCREPLGQPRRRGTSGVAVDHLAVEVLGDDGSPVAPGVAGEITVTSRSAGPWAGAYRTMLGYWGEPELTAATLAEGRLHTGDLGSLDGDGFLTVQARRSELIVRGGSNVSPAEVEVAIRSLDGVDDVVVVGMDDDRLGQVPAAVVVGSVQPGEVLAHCAVLLARYKVPARCVIAQRIPRGANGKPLRDEVLALLAVSGG
ncbi:MAG: AMP-binding protein [Ilumatobacteraceae bacterium]